MAIKIIDKDSPIPAYYQVQTNIKERIYKAEWTIKLPSEAKLCEEYETSRITIRQALGELQKEGIITKMRGKGAFINKKAIPFVHSLNYTLASADRLGRKNKDITAVTLEIKLIKTPYTDIVEGLNINEDIPVIYLKRLFFFKESPIALGRSWLSSKVTPNLWKEGLIDNELSTTLKQRYNISAKRVDDYLEAIRGIPMDNDLLDISHDTPLLLVKGVSYLEDDTPLEYSHTVWPGDRVSLKISLQNLIDTRACLKKGRYCAI